MSGSETDGKAIAETLSKLEKAGTGRGEADSETIADAAQTSDRVDSEMLADFLKPLQKLEKTKVSASEVDSDLLAELDRADVVEARPEEDDGAIQKSD